MGLVHGMYRDRSIAIDPDNRATVRLDLPHLPDVRLSSSSPHPSFKKEGMAIFDWGSTYLNGYFRTRLSVLQVDGNRHRARLTEIERIIKRWRFKLRYLKVSGGTLTCSFKYGQATYIPKQVLEEFLPDMIRFAKAIESLFGDST